jgi:DNA-binding CsgD family transcriptional regulator
MDVGTIDEHELKSMLRLAGEAGELPHNSDQRRRHILQGLCRLIGAQSGLLFVLGRDPLGRLMDHDYFLTTGMSPIQDLALRDYVLTENPQPTNPIVPLILRARGDILTQHRRHVTDDEGLWYRSDFFEQIQSPLEFDDMLYPRMTLPDGRILAVGFLRPLGERMFTDRDCMLIDVFHSTAGRLYGTFETSGAAAPPTDPRFSALPRRLRPVLEHLLRGDAEKQVAQKLGLSRHTVHEYIKVLYKKLNVSSRAELLAQFIEKDVAPTPRLQTI